MSKKILILSGSPRKGGNSDILCDEFLRGAQGAGHKVKKVRVAEKKVAPCSGCYYCSTHGGACVHKDDMADILQKMIDADVIVLASPVYFYSISAQLKAVIDRTVARWQEVKDKEFYYITTMADEEKTSADTTLACFRGYADCVAGAVEKGTLVASGVYAVSMSRVRCETPLPWHRLTRWGGTYNGSKTDRRAGYSGRICAKVCRT